MTEKELTAYEAMAKLRLTEENRAWVLDKMAVLEESFRRLEAVDTAAVAPLVSVLDIQNVFREDVAVQLISRGELMARAAEEYDGYFVVPKTLE